MKLNSDIKINNGPVVLVPYRKRHVQKYHHWMKSSELQELTASSPLSLEEEYNMQQSWYSDIDKCTFIILDSELFDGEDEVVSMIGDTNLFLIPNPDEKDSKAAEIEIMIAETAFRNKGRGRVATLSMLRYGVEESSIKKYVAKIGLDNEPSIFLFKKLKFYEESISEVFNEVTLKLNVDESWLEWLYCNTPHYTISPHMA